MSEFASYFDDAVKIHAICADEGMSESEARLLTYMHAKASESEKGIDYFLEPADEDAEALEIMLGVYKRKLPLPPSESLDKEGQDAVNLILTIADRISNLDNILAKECGMENRLSGELRARLKLYKDTEFRNKMISLYNTKIQPLLPLYNKEKVDRAFSHFRELQLKKEIELMNAAGLNPDNPD